MLLLKIFYGPHSGAEIPLASDVEFVIGQDEECDFVLNDPKVSPQHLKFTLHGQQVVLQPLDGDVHVNAKKIDQKGDKCNFFDLITVGSTGFAIGPMDAKWPEIEKHDVNNMDTSNAASVESEVQMPLLEEKVGKASSPKAEFVEKRYSTVLYQYIAVLLVILIIAAVVGWSLISKGPPLKVVNPVTLINDKLLEMGAKNVTITEDPSGRLILKGYLVEPVEKEKLRQFCISAYRNTQFNVFSEAELLGAIQDTLDAYNFKLNLANLGAGHFSISGITDTQQKLDSVIGGLIKDISGIKHIENKTKSLSNMKSKIQKLIAEFDGHADITLLADNAQFTISGMLDSKKLEEWNSFFAKNIEKMDSDISVINKVIAKVIENNETYQVETDKKLTDIKVTDAIKLSVLSITEGRNPYVTMKNGVKLFKGAHIDAGYRIKDIKQQYIVLEKNNMEYIHYIKGA